MLSRVADTTYWMSRYLERVENYARFMDVNFNLSLELHPDVSEQWKPLVQTTGDWELYESLHGEVDKKKVIYFLGFDSNNANSIFSCIRNARENARAIRPEITKDVWEKVNGLYYKVKDGIEKKVWEKKDPRKFFIEVKESCQLLAGIYDSTISRTEGWHFGKLGQLIERADKTSRVLDVKYHMLLPDVKSVGTPTDLVQWSALLKSVSAYDMYRKKYGKLNPSSICEFLIFDKNFPRAIMNCVEHAHESLQVVSDKDDEQLNKADKQMGIFKAHLEYTDVAEVLNQGLHEFLDDTQIKLNNISTAIYETFFSSENILSQQSHAQ
ncbi:MAG: alpha-E domain-containing protein [Reichenbachiella sp.]|uniref:alpha-E domain-containing protein n=1 Tax=Reichenbachiella sp. TaxID=2184521 RepID=UPI003296C8AC